MAEDAEDEPPRVVATFDSYAGMLEAIRARVNELQVTGTALDQYIGLPFGYYSKIAGARPIRRLGMTSLAPGCHAVPVRRGALPVLSSVRSAISAAGATVSQCDKKAFRCKIFL